MKPAKEVLWVHKQSWLEKGQKLFGDEIKLWKFVCPNCGHIQCGQDFIDLEVPEGESKFYFSCIGRWTDDCKGEIGNKISPCNYTNGGLFNLAKVCVTDDHGDETWVFEFAEPEKKESET